MTTRRAIQYERHRIENVHNMAQYPEVYKRTLCVCSAGLLRSPSLAFFLSQPPYNRNTRAAGSHIQWALVPVDEVLLEWADEIVFVNAANEAQVCKDYTIKSTKKVYTLNVPDHYGYREQGLLKAIEAELKRVGFQA